MNPREKDRFFWVDDAFGATQFQPGLADSWNAVLPAVKTAIAAGNRLVLTSRNYIWFQARQLLKLSSFEPLVTGQVIIDLQSLSKDERHQILYNHVKLGDQPPSFRKVVKPFLKQISENPGFLPETARRLGSKYFTQKLRIDAVSLQNFVENPKSMLVDVLSELGPAEKAAVALVFTSGGRCSAPVIHSNNIGLVAKLFGVSPAVISQAVEALNGSLLNRISSDGTMNWVFKHPTVGDAFAEYLRGNLELADLFVTGARLDIVLREIVCGQMDVPGANLFATSAQRDVLIKRLLAAKQDWNTRQAIADFLTTRADRDFLLAFLNQRPGFLSVTTVFYDTAEEKPPATPPRI
ncbi:MAG: hypothetical protein IPL62_04580 [Caulobacteraceae bacterium]|nr:hypothetical protein [Caulobacteraceae bacterium]